MIQESNYIFNNSMKTSIVDDKYESDTNVVYLVSSLYQPAL